MKQLLKFQLRLKGITHAISRFPLTALFLLAAAFVNAVDIETNKDYLKIIVTLVVGAFISAAAQVIYERYFYKQSNRIILMSACAVLTLGYYLIIKNAPRFGMEIGIRTGVALFALLIAFIWVPVIKSKVTFNESFMAAFKFFFNSLLYSGVIFGGINIIIAAIDRLLFTVNYTSYSHTANIIFVLFAPMYFLSLIPNYPGKSDENKTQEKLNIQEETINKAAFCPRFLEILISYIIIPLIAVFTVILVIYIGLNIGGKFWTDNLLEPMLISYAITVILVYILSSRLENRFAVLFRRIFPKILVPIVLFQIASSVISLGDTGITHTRYFVILFGIFAAAAGVVFSIIPVEKNGIIAAMLIVFCTVSIIPPVDAFTISKANQVNMLKGVLIKNNMLENNVIKPNKAIPDKDKKIIVNTVQYLRMMEYNKQVEWLPDNLYDYNSFNKTFGFDEYENRGEINQPVYLRINQQTPIDITGFDTFAYVNFYIPDRNTDFKICDFEKSGKSYTLRKYTTKESCEIKLLGENNQEIIGFDTAEIFDKFYNYTMGKELISEKEATFLKENDKAKIKFVVQGLNIDKMPSQDNYNADLYVFIKIK